jgi:hypothetical protein
MDIFTVIFNYDDGEDKTYTIEGCFDSKISAYKKASATYYERILPKLTKFVNWSQDDFVRYQNEWRKPKFNNVDELNQMSRDFIAKYKIINNDEEYIDYLNDVKNFVDSLTDVLSCMECYDFVFNVEVIQFQLNSTKTPYHYVVE